MDRPPPKPPPPKKKRLISIRIGGVVNPPPPPSPYPMGLVHNQPCPLIDVVARSYNCKFFGEWLFWHTQIASIVMLSHLFSYMHTPSLIVPRCYQTTCNYTCFSVCGPPTGNDNDPCSLPFGCRAMVGLRALTGWNEAHYGKPPP